MFDFSKTFNLSRIFALPDTLLLDRKTTTVIKYCSFLHYCKEKFTSSAAEVLCKCQRLIYLVNCNMSLRIIYIFFLQGLLILLLPYEKLVNLYMHITVGVLLIVIEIVSRVYLEEELAIEESQNQHELVSSPAYYKRQVGLLDYNIYCT